MFRINDSGIDRMPNSSNTDGYIPKHLVIAKPGNLVPFFHILYGPIRYPFSSILFSIMAFWDDSILVF